MKKHKKYIKQYSIGLYVHKYFKWFPKYNGQIRAFIKIYFGENEHDLK